MSCNDLKFLGYQNVLWALPMSVLTLLEAVGEFFIKHRFVLFFPFWSRVLSECAHKDKTGDLNFIQLNCVVP